ncbi:M23 family metallopeptidase [Qipengyuania sp. XHP0207]|uniref:M23 family metallopeptidase n=1 Tax=Qipengyuania sp. XHP0207 TaxID=3038078 RepID=UPI00241C4421|nr:M23 family metallopeptidase [Qipengyuania sp. XHP0207]MDG5748019.1 M23 family metallopeptidase [Qipengyuania sp. XHP0207]
MSFARVAPLVLLAAACVPASAEQAEPQGAPAPVDLPPASAMESDAVPLSVPVARQEVPATFSYGGEIEQGGWIRGTAPAGTVALTIGDTKVPLDDSGRFFAGFDRDAGGAATLVATLADGRVVRDRLSVKPRDWNIERVNVARRAGRASESFMQRRRPELDAISDARQQRTGAEGWRQDFIWPVTGRISGRFGSQRIYRGEPGSYHSGLDIAGGAGTTYVAPADGVVTLAEPDFSLEGQLVIIDHGQGLNSAFLHSAELFVREGQAVKQGQPLGRIGASGRATGPHLHWSITWNGARLDPLLFLGPMP